MTLTSILHSDGRLERSCKQASAGMGKGLQFNAGAFMVRPDAGVYEAVMQSLYDRWSGFRCAGDQSSFNTLFSLAIHCVGHGFNCYDPYILQGACAASLTALGRWLMLCLRAT